MNAPFAPILVNALYPTLERGLTADVLAARALGGQASTVCTAHLVAGHGRVTDVLDVPADTVAGQLEHIFATRAPSGARIGIAGSATSVEACARLLGMHLQGPIVLDATLSGPSGEDLADGRVREALVARFPLADVVSLRRVDAELVVGMEIVSLDDAQVAVQRLHRQGARSALLRLGRLEGEDGPMATDLAYDGDDFGVFEAPWIEAPAAFTGASSALHLALLKGLAEGRSLFEALQAAKAFVTDAIRLRDPAQPSEGLAYFAAAGVSAGP